MRLLELGLAACLAASACRSAGVPARFEQTPRAEKGVVVLYGDVRPRLAAEVWRDDATRERLAVIDAIAAEDPDLVVNSGDLVIQGDDACDWAQFDRETAPIREREIPYVAGLGNHDLCGDEERALRQYFARFPEPTGSRWREVRAGGVAFVLLDTNFRNAVPGMIERELAWLDATLDRAETDESVGAVVLVTHHPPFTNVIAHEGSDWMRREVLPRIAAHPKVGAVFSGHAHTYERFDADGVPCVVAGGGGAPLMDVDEERPQFADLYRGPRRHHYCRIALGPRIECEVVMLGADGRTWSVADRFAIVPRPMKGK